MPIPPSTGRMMSNASKQLPRHMPDTTDIRRSVSTVRSEIDWLREHGVLSAYQYQMIVDHLPKRSSEDGDDYANDADVLDSTRYEDKVPNAYGATNGMPNGSSTRSPTRKGRSSFSQLLRDKISKRTPTPERHD